MQNLKPVDCCELYFEQLIREGCDETLAADRTYDALESLYDPQHSVFDKRDKQFEAFLISNFSD